MEKIIAIISFVILVLGFLGGLIGIWTALNAKIAKNERDIEEVKRDYQKEIDYLKSAKDKTDKRLDLILKKIDENHSAIINYFISGEKPLLK
jgi:hypothetical protein